MKQIIPEKSSEKVAKFLNKNSLPLHVGHPLPNYAQYCLLQYSFGPPTISYKKRLKSQFFVLII